MQSQFLAKIRQQNPLIHNLTNIVVANYSANGLLALGASPLMSDNVAEVADIQQFNRGLVINIGTLFSKGVEAMILAGKTANQQHIPVVLDPVGVAATAYRRETIDRLLAEVKFAVIRGNAGELACIAGEQWQSKGVDAGQGSADVISIAQRVAQRYQCVVAISGATDVVSNGANTALVHNGTPMFPKITGSGCLLSAVCAAFVAVADPSQYFAATLEACAAYAIAGELAAQPLQPTQYGQFNMALLDALGALNTEQITQYGRVDYV